KKNTTSYTGYTSALVESGSTPSVASPGMTLPHSYVMRFQPQGTLLSLIQSTVGKQWSFFFIVTTHGTQSNVTALSRKSSIAKQELVKNLNSTPIANHGERGGGGGEEEGGWGRKLTSIVGNLPDSGKERSQVLGGLPVDMRDKVGRREPVLV